MKRCPFLLLAVFALLISACSLASDVTPPPGQASPVPQEINQTTAKGPLYPLQPVDPASGKLIFVEKCAPCHGADGIGDGSMSDRLANPPPAIGNPEVSRQARPADWYQIVTLGKMDKQMPPFGSLSDKQRWDVVAYVYSLSISEETITQGKDLYNVNCAGCHGLTGDGQGASAANLDKKPTQLIDLEWAASRSVSENFQSISTGMAPSMPAFESSLSESERWVIAEYVQWLAFQTPGGSDKQLQTSEDLSPSPEDATPDAGSLLGVINGTVTNASGGAIPSGMDILLHGFDGMQVAITQTVKLGEAGTFTFESVPLVPGRAFLATVDIEGITYGSSVSSVVEGQTTLQLPIEVYETTTDSSGLVIDRLHVFLEPVDDTSLRVIELLVISNPGKKTVVAKGDSEPAWSFPVPLGATNLEFQDGELGGRFIPTADGFGDMAAIQPGMGAHQVLFAFELPFKRKADLFQIVSLPTNAVVVLVPANSVKIKADNLTDAGTRTVEGFDYHTFNGGGMAPGEALSLSISKNSSFAFPGLSTSSSTGLAIGLVVLLVVAALAGVLIYRRSKNLRAEITQENIPSDDRSPETAEGLMDAILVLDDLYKAGELPEEAYTQRRAELKSQLSRIIK